MQEVLPDAPIYNKTTYFFRDGKDTVYVNVIAYKVFSSTTESRGVSKEQLKQDFEKLGRAEAVQIRLREKKWLRVYSETIF